MLLTRKRTVLAKIETAYGVDPVPSGAANAILVGNLTPTPQSATLVKRNIVRPYLGNAEELPTAIYAGIDFEVELAGSGAAGTVPAWGVLMRACGFSETISAGVGVTYAPISNSFESATIYFNEDGVLHKLTGARGTVSIDANANTIPVMKFKFMGIYSPVVDAAAPTVSFTAFKMPLAVNLTNTPTFSLHGVSTAVLSTLTLDIANTLAFRQLVGAQQALITDRVPVGTVSIEAGPVATHDWWTEAESATTAPLQLIHGTTAGNIIELDAPLVQLTNPQYQDLQGVAMLQMNAVLVPSTAGNDEFSMQVR